MSGHGDAWARPRAVLWSGRGSPLGPGHTLGCPGCTCLYPWRWRWCADVFGPGVIRPALRILERRASERARCLGTAVHEHGRARYCGLGRRSPLGLGCSLRRPGGTCSWVWRWRCVQICLALRLFRPCSVRSGAACQCGDAHARPRAVLRSGRRSLLVRGAP